MTDVLGLLHRQRLVAVIREDSLDQARQQSERLISAGLVALEVTFTTPGAAQLIAELSALPNLLVGAGTVLSHDDACSAINAGASFVVSPSLRPEVMRAADRARVLAIPGAFTPTEISTALDLGARAVKLFPASVLGLGGLRALRDVFPAVQFVCTGGIGPDNAQAWLDAGSSVVGCGGSLSKLSLLDLQQLADELRQ